MDYSPVNRNHDKIKYNTNCVQEMMFCLDVMVLAKSRHFTALHCGDQAKSLQVESPVREVSKKFI